VVSFSTDQVEVSGVVVVPECLKAHDTHSLVRALDDDSIGNRPDSSLRCALPHLRQAAAGRRSEPATTPLCWGAR